jgi:hypothetical protein
MKKLLYARSRPTLLQKKRGLALLPRWSGLNAIAKLTTKHFSNLSLK